MPELDPFHFYRFMLTVLVSVYTVSKLVMTIWQWQSFAPGASRTMGMLRVYVVVHLLRVRFSRFAWDVVFIVGLALLLYLLLRETWVYNALHREILH